MRARNVARIERHEPTCRECGGALTLVGEPPRLDHLTGGCPGVADTDEIDDTVRDALAESNEPGAVEEARGAVLILGMVTVDDDEAAVTSAAVDYLTRIA